MATLTEHLEDASESDAAPWQQESLPLHSTPPPASLCILRAAEADAKSVTARRFAVARVLTTRRFDAGRRLAQYFRLPILELYVRSLVDSARSGESDGPARLHSLLDGVRRVVSDRQWGKVSHFRAQRCDAFRACAHLCPPSCQVMFSVLDHLGPDLALPYVRNAFKAALVDVRLRVAIELLAGDVHGATELAVQCRSTAGHALVQAQLKFDLAEEEGKIDAQ